VRKNSPYEIIAFILMIFSAWLAYDLTPRKLMSDRHQFKLESLIPKEFGEWKLDDLSTNGQIVSPELQEKLQVFYSDTLSRTYVNKNNDRIMLSIAYGKEQTEELRVHDPKICYTAQGFLIKDTENKTVNVGERDVPVIRVNAIKDLRIEPISYWILVGDYIANKTTDRKIMQLKYGLGGEIPDGMLVRVSSIDADVSRAERIQNEFITQMYHALKGKDRAAIFGQDQK